MFWGLHFFIVFPHPLLSSSSALRAPRMSWRGWSTLDPRLCALRDPQRPPHWSRGFPAPRHCPLSLPLLLAARDRSAGGPRIPAARSSAEAARRNRCTPSIPLSAWLPPRRRWLAPLRLWGAQLTSASCRCSRGALGTRRHKHRAFAFVARHLLFFLNTNFPTAGWLGEHRKHNMFLFFEDLS